MSLSTSDDEFEQYRARFDVSCVFSIDSYTSLLHRLTLQIHRWKTILYILWRRALSVRVPGCQKLQMTA